MIVSATEDAQFIPERSNNEHIDYQTKHAAYSRNYLESHPHARERKNARLRESYKKKCDLNRALSKARCSDQHLDAGPSSLQIDQDQLPDGGHGSEVLKHGTCALCSRL